MARELVVVWLGRARRDAWESLCADYIERIGHVWPLREVVLRPAEGDLVSRLRREAELIEAALPPSAGVIALDRRGKARGSRELAERLMARLESNPNPLAFVIGSDLGIDPKFLDRADERWSLGPLTLPHALARLVLLEQLFRASSFATGTGYHREGVG